MSLSSKDHAALANAIETGELEIVNALLAQHPDLVNHADWTPPPLHCAILWDQLEVAELLLEKGADIEMLDPDQQSTPLRYAIMYCKTGLIPALLSRGANAGPIVDGGTTALQLANAALAGEFKEFDDLPRPESYGTVVDVLIQAGLKQ